MAPIAWQLHTLTLPNGTLNRISRIDSKPGKIALQKYPILASEKPMPFHEKLFFEDPSSNDHRIRLMQKIQNQLKIFFSILGRILTSSAPTCKIPKPPQFCFFFVFLLTIWSVPVLTLLVLSIYIHFDNRPFHKTRFHPFFFTFVRYLEFSSFFFTKV